MNHIANYCSPFTYLTETEETETNCRNQDEDGVQGYHIERVFHAVRRCVFSAKAQHSTSLLETPAYNTNPNPILNPRTNPKPSSTDPTLITLIGFERSANSFHPAVRERGEKTRQWLRTRRPAGGS